MPAPLLRLAKPESQILRNPWSLQRTIVPMADEQQDGPKVLAPGEREGINRIAAAHGARNVRVFGSVRWGEANNSSDLDLLVDMSRGGAFSISWLLEMSLKRSLASRSM